MIIAQGAEAIIRREGNKVIKERVSKGYRVPVLDSKLIKGRTKREVKLLQKLSDLIPVPEVLEFDTNKIVMKFIAGDKLADHLDNYSKDKRLKICNLIGKQVAKMHAADIIHGDLTTSNMILKEGEIFFIDFGLGFVNEHVEHKAVDLHLIRQALESKHYRHYEECFDALIKGYKTSKDSKLVFERLEKVEKRGRYK